MREIKFRGRDGDNWYYGSLFVNECGHTVISVPKSFWMKPVNADTVGQYTGLKDSEGREIYEGDIVERDNLYFQKTCPAQPKTIVGVVEWCDGEFIVKGSYKLFNSSDKFPIRIIGNVHDNPELLNNG